MGRKGDMTHSPLYYPSATRVKKIIKSLEGRAINHRNHIASNTDRLRQKIREEARAFLARLEGAKSPNHFQVIDEDAY